MCINCHIDVELLTVYLNRPPIFFNDLMIKHKTLQSYFKNKNQQHKFDLNLDSLLSMQGSELHM